MTRPVQLCFHYTATNQCIALYTHVYVNVNVQYHICSFGQEIWVSFRMTNAFSDIGAVHGDATSELKVEAAAKVLDTVTAPSKRRCNGKGGHAPADAKHSKADAPVTMQGPYHELPTEEFPTALVVLQNYEELNKGKHGHKRTKHNKDADADDMSDTLSDALSEIIAEEYSRHEAEGARGTDCVAVLSMLCDRDSLTARGTPTENGDDHGGCNAGDIKLQDPWRRCSNVGASETELGGVAPNMIRIRGDIA